MAQSLNFETNYGRSMRQKNFNEANSWTAFGLNPGHLAPSGTAACKELKTLDAQAHDWESVMARNAALILEI